MAASDRSAPDTVTGPGEALYLYCLARGGALGAIEGPGVDGEHPLSVIPFKDVVAVVSTVKVDDFCGPAAEARMNDLGWVGLRVCRHEAVVERAMRASPVVPARFAVLFSSPERLAVWLDAHQDAISRALDRLTNHDEWAVKGTLDRRKAEARLPRAVLEGQRGQAASIGARYLQDRRDRAAAGETLDAWLREVCAGIARDLCGSASEFREREITAGVSKEQGVPIMNWAFLVSRSVLDEFAARIESINTEYAEQGLTLNRSGPWPPYTFCPPLEPEPSE